MALQESGSFLFTVFVPAALAVQNGEKTVHENGKNDDLDNENGEKTADKNGKEASLFVQDTVRGPTKTVKNGARQR